MIHIIYGSASDKDYFKQGIEYLIKNKIQFREFIISAHRNFKRLNQYIDKINAGEYRLDAAICVAGLAAVMPGIIAAGTEITVIAVPVPKKYFDGIDALLSIIQSPSGAPVVSVGLHEKAPLNAAVFAHRMLRKIEKAQNGKYLKGKIQRRKRLTDK